MMKSTIASLLGNGPLTLGQLEEKTGNRRDRGANAYKRPLNQALIQLLKEGAVVEVKTRSGFGDPTFKLVAKNPRRRHSRRKTTRKHRLIGMNPPIHKSAREFAIQHRINLGRLENGYYFISSAHMFSTYPTAASAIVMMKRFLRQRGR